MPVVYDSVISWVRKRCVVTHELKSSEQSDDNMPHDFGHLEIASNIQVIDDLAAESLKDCKFSEKTDFLAAKDIFCMQKHSEI